MTNKACLIFLLLFPVLAYSQFLNNFYGSVESIGQYYVDDDKISISNDVKFRSNNYINFIYTAKNINANIQFESYYKERILGYSPVYDKTLGIAAVSLSYNHKNIEAVLGSFHGQFGSGLLFRSWEDRPLGLNNSLFGASIKYHLKDKIVMTAIAGKQRNGFKLSDGSLYGLDFQYDVSTAFNLAFSYLNRYQKIENNSLNSPNYTNLYSLRANYLRNNFYSHLEYVYKGKDALVEFGNVIYSKMFTGNALLINFGYFTNGFGIDATFRRMENMAMNTDRESYNNIFNDLIVNYLPVLTKQHNLSLSNIYVYQSQAQLSFIPPGKAGEIGQQIDVFYNFSNHQSLLGKFKTELVFNYSSWYGLDASFDFENRNYTAKYFSYGENYYTDVNIELKNKWSKLLSTNLIFIHQYYNKQLLESGIGTVKANIIGIDLFYTMPKSKKLHFQIEHLWNDDDKNNWAAFFAEYQFHRKYSIYVNDLYNYGNDQVIERIHYYNLGMTYKNKKTKFSLNYGRQRGGLICVGGICRFVPNSNGLRFILNVFI